MHQPRRPEPVIRLHPWPHPQPKVETLHFLTLGFSLRASFSLKERSKRGREGGREGGEGGGREGEAGKEERGEAGKEEGGKKEGGGRGGGEREGQQ